MASMEKHPTVVLMRERMAAGGTPAPRPPLDAAALRQICLEAGADDAGFVELERPSIADQRADILAAFPRTKALVSLVVRMNRENIRSTARSAANLEFHSTGDEVNLIAREIVARLGEMGVRSFYPSMGFPMEMDRFPGKVWVVSHKPVAVEAGLGKMGIHRNVIHPKFGNFILLGTVFMDAGVSAYGAPLDYNPCLECKLCVAACPVGAIGADGHFDGSACYTHNYREFMGGFTDWVELVAESSDALAYRRKVSDAESASMWQSLSYGANYKAAYCMAVCPAGEEVIAPFLENRAGYLQDVVKPLQEKVETVYAVAGSDAEPRIAQRFPHKKIKRVRNSLRPRSIPAFLDGLSISFQRDHSANLGAVYHFTFTGREPHKATVEIRNRSISVQRGHEGKGDLRLIADSDTWLGFLAGERNLAWALIRRKIRIKGPPRLLLAFGRCFPT